MLKFDLVIQKASPRHRAAIIANHAAITPAYLQLQWFDTVEEVKISSELRSKRWNTEVTERDRLYLAKLGMDLP